MIYGIIEVIHGNASYMVNFHKKCILKNKIKRQVTDIKYRIKNEIMTVTCLKE